MPIVPRFIQQTSKDPNVAEVPRFGEAFNAGMLAGTQVKRTKLAEEEMKQRGEMLRMSIEDRANARTTQEDLAKVEGFFMEKGNEPLDAGGVGSAPLAPGQQGPAAVTSQDVDRMEIEGAKGFMESLRSPEAKAQFAQQFTDYKKDREIQFAAKQTQARLQDALVNFSETPGAEPFMSELEGIGAQLDMLDDPGMTQAQRAALADGVQSKLAEVQRLAQTEIDRKRMKLEAVATIEQLSSQFPATTGLGAQIRSLGTAISLGGLDPKDGVRAAYGLVTDMVPDPRGGKGFVDKDFAAKWDLAEQKQKHDLAIGAMRNGASFESVDQALKFAESAAAHDRKMAEVTGSMEPLPPFMEYFLTAMMALDPKGIDAQIGGGEAEAPAQGGVGPRGPMPSSPTAEEPAPVAAPSDRSRFQELQASTAAGPPTPEAAAKKKAEEDKRRKELLESRKRGVQSRTRGVGGN